MEHFRAAIREAEARGARVEAPHPRLLEFFGEKGRRGDPADWAALGSPALRSCAMPHQVAAVNRIVEELGGRAFLAMPTGTGKTLTAAAVAAHYGGCVLVVASAQHQWVEEFEAWAEFPFHSIVNGAQGELPPEGEPGVVVCTYKSVGLRADVAARRWTTVIVDESHKMGGDCDTNAAVVRACERARCVLLVSATPMKGRPAELFNSFRCLLPKVFTNRRAFEARYCDGKVGRFGYEARGATNTEELAALFDRLSVSCDKAAALPDLPPIRFHDVRLEMPRPVLEEFERMQAEYEELTRRAEQAPEHLRVSIKLKRDALSMRMYQRTGEAKAPFCVAWLLELLGRTPPDEKVLVFVHHVSVMDEACAALEAAGVGHVRVDGTVSAKRRHESLKAIRDPADPRARVAVLTLGTCAESLTLAPGACVVVMFQLAFTPAINDQAYARAWRKGATRPVEVYRLIAGGTADETVLRIHASKERTTERIFKKLRAD